MIRLRTLGSLELRGLDGTELERPLPGRRSALRAGDARRSSLHAPHRSERRAAPSAREQKG